MQHVLSLANNLDLGVVAEGIETIEQADCLTKAGCRHGQGYMYAKPDLIDRLIV